MKSLILYSSLKPGSGRKAVTFGRGKNAVTVHIRAKLVPLSPMDALDLAKPQPGEVVLNTIPV